MSKRNYQGVERTFLNCAVCHTSTVRDAPDAQPRIVLGMPGNRFRVWGLQKFLFSCAKDPKFSADFVVPEIDRAMRARGETLGLLERRVDRKSVVQGTRGSVRVDLGGRRFLKKKNNYIIYLS